VHRIGRTGRAGRNGEAILFIAPRERNMLRAIERATRQTIEPMNLPSVDTVNAHRIAKFKERVTGALATAELGVYRSIVEQVEAETGTTLIDIAAALATLAQGPTPLLLGTSVKPAGRAEPAATPATRTEPPGAKAPAAKVPGAAAPPATAVRPLAQLVQPVPPAPPARPQARPRAAEMETFRLEVGSIHGNRGRAHRPRRHSRGSQLRRLAGRHAEAYLHGTAESARGRQGTAHHASLSQTAQTAAQSSRPARGTQTAHAALSARPYV